MKVLVATDKPFAAVAVSGIRQVVEEAGMELVLLEKYTQKSELLDAVKGVSAMIVRSDIVDAEVIAAADTLKIVVRAGAGYDNIDLKACTDKGIIAMNTPGQNANAVAELAIGMMIFQARNQFNGTSGTELLGKSLGIHAYGNVGRNIARIAKGMGMTVFAFDAYVKDEVMLSEGITPLHSVEELYSQCQYLSVNIPATAETKKSINHALLSKMPKGAMLVNTARKEVINEEELVKLMEERTDFRYVSDIAPDNSAVFAEKFAGRCFFTPKKMGAQTSEANINAGIAAAKQIVDFLKNGVDRFRVN